MENVAEGSVLQVAKPHKPETAQLFENLLWVNTPKHWIFNTTYFRYRLFISITIPINDEENNRIRRSFDYKVIKSRSEDLWGMAIDCAEELRREINN